MSERERNAWARAIYIARDIKNKHGVNLFKAFNSFKEFKLFMYGNLISHRASWETKFMAVDDDVVLRKTWNAAKEELFGAGRPTEEQRYVRQLFDKMKFRK